MDTVSGGLAGRPALIYGSYGWGFESLRARLGQRPVRILQWPSLLPWVLPNGLL